MSEHFTDEDSGADDAAWRQLSEDFRQRTLLLLRLFRATWNMPPDKAEIIETRWRFVMAIRRQTE